MTASSRRPGAIIVAQRSGMRPAVRPSGLGLRVEAHVESFRRAGIQRIVVVWPSTVRDLPKGLGDVDVVVETRRGAGPFDAVVTGLFALGCAPALVMPVSHEVVGDATLALLVEEVVDHPLASAILPRFGSRLGYPVALTRPGIERLVRDAADAEGRHDFEALLSNWLGVYPLDVVDGSVVGPSGLCESAPAP